MWFVAVALIVSAACLVWAVNRLEFKTSRDGLIGSDNEYSRLLREYREEFHSAEDYVIMVEGRDPSRNRAMVDRLRDALVSAENNPHPVDAKNAQLFAPSDVFDRVNLSAIEPWSLYYLSETDLEAVRDSLQDFRRLVLLLQAEPTLASFFDAMNRMLQQMETASPTERARMMAFLPTVSALVRQLVDEGATGQGAAWLSPWAAAFFTEDMIRETSQRMQWNGYHVFGEGRIFLLLVHPDTPQEDGTGLSRPATIEKLRRIMDDVRRDDPGPAISLTGDIVLGHDEMAESQRHARVATVVTMVLCGLIFAYGFHEWLRPVLAMMCIAMVVAVCMGCATMWPGSLNIITITFAVMIIGLGIDLKIQFIARYEEDLGRGMDRHQAVRSAMSQTGPGIMTAGVTNAAAFYAMMLSGFRGTIELGFIAGSGLLVAALVAMLVLPSLLLLVHRDRELTHIPARADATPLERRLLAHPHRVIWVCGLLTLLAATVFWQVRFDFNVLNLQSRGLESVDAELRLLQSNAQSTIYASVVSDTLDDARALQSKLETLATVSSVASIVPMIPERQEAKRPLVVAIKEQLNGINMVVPASNTVDVPGLMQTLGVLRLRSNRLASELGKEDERGAAALRSLSAQLETARNGIAAIEPGMASKSLAAHQQRFYRQLKDQLDLMARQETGKHLTIADLPAEIRRVLVGKTGKLVLQVYPRDNIWDRPALETFVREVQSVAPSATGTPMGLYEFVDVLQRGYRNAALWAFGAISVLILLDFRSVRATLLTMIPLVAGVMWMMAIMVLPRVAADGLNGMGLHRVATVVGRGEIQFNPANIMVLPLIIGIGVAYGIYVVQRYREDGETILYAKSTGRAVVLSGLTTLVAFGSLIAGAHLGIRSLGVVMTIGVACCLVTSLILLPALLEIARRRQWRL
jgi:hypothetical protein